MRLTALDEAAIANGLYRGQALTDARAILPELDCISEDGSADRRLLSAIADWCDRYTPLISCEMPDWPQSHACDGNLFLDITGCAHLFGGEEALLKDLLARLFNQGFAASAAIAPTPGAAHALARFQAQTGVASLPMAAAIAASPGDLAAQLASLPVAALRLPNETVSALARVGLQTIAHVMTRPRAPLARRFGKELLLRLDQALGDCEESISPRMPAPSLMAERRFAEPIGLIEDIERIVLRLATHLNTAMEQRGEGARLLDLALWRVDGKVFRLAAAASRPLREPLVMLNLFRERFASLNDEFDAGCGFDMIRLGVGRSEKLNPAEPAFDAQDTGAGAACDLVDRLSARLGPQAVVRPCLEDSHLPERSEKFVPAIQQNRNRIPGVVAPPPGPPPLRPLRLFAHPEPVDAMAGLPDGPPLRFRWRRLLHEVIRSEGPERIAGEWWRVGASGIERDYFRVEDRLGRRFWLFREGLYGDAQVVPRWFIHGLFA